MVSLRAIQAVALSGAMILGGMTNSVAAPVQNEVRQALFSKCENAQGKLHGICMRAMARQMQTYTEEANTLHKQCVESNTSDDCDEQLEAFWVSRIPSQ